MKCIRNKILLITAAGLLFISGFSELKSAPVRKEIPKKFGIEWGIGVSDSFYPIIAFRDDPNAQKYMIEALYTSIRLDLFFGIRFDITDYISTGIEAGANFLPNLVSPTLTIIFLDIPLRNFYRFGNKSFYFQAAWGAYIGLFPLWMYNNVPSYEIGPLLDARFNFGGFYISCSWIIADNNTARNIDHLRFGLGYTGVIY